MIELDGSYGEGGGQILRSALTLSLLTGKPFRIDRIRAGRKKPGLRHQHRAAVKAAQRVGNARIEGNTLGSTSLVFEPQGLTPGVMRFTVGTAGSTTLILQTILLPLLKADGASSLVIEGGTHNPFAPPWDFLARTFLPLLKRMGADVEAKILAPGFHPAGGGVLSVEIRPCELFLPMDLVSRGEHRETRVRAVVSRLPLSIAERELHVLRKTLRLDPRAPLQAEEFPSKGPGNVVFVEVESEHVTEVFTGFGEKGVKAETVAEQAGRRARDYLDGTAPVGEYLADQLMLPLPAPASASPSQVPNPLQQSVAPQAVALIRRSDLLHTRWPERQADRW